MRSDKNLRIGFISEHYPPTDGGVATSTQRVARNLVRLGAMVHVCCFDHHRPIESPDYVVSETDEGVRLSRVGPFFLKRPELSADRVSEKLKATFRRRCFSQMVRLLENDQIDLILSFYLLNAGFVAGYVARALAVPHVAGIRGNDMGRNMFHTERFAAIRWVVEGAQHVVAVNHFLRDRTLLAFPDVGHKLSVIPNSTDTKPIGTDERREARAQIALTTGWPSNSLIAVFVGTLREKKGITALLSSIAALPLGSTVRLLVVGPEIGAVERQLCGDVWSRLQAEGRLWCTGRIPREAVGQWVAGGDVIIMPSLDDGMANGVLEGMALGLCPVVSPVFSDLVQHEQTGYVVPAHDTPLLTRTLHALAADPPRASALGQAARSSLSAWRPTEEAAAYLSCFSTMIGA